MDVYLNLDVEDDVPADSPLRDEARWPELLVLPPDFDADGEARDQRRCESCGLLLRDSQESDDGLWKSCPSCSRADGSRHVYLARPGAFGTTEKRKTAANPDGVQSYCEACRKAGTPPAAERRNCPINR